MGGRYSKKFISKEVVPGRAAVVPGRAGLLCVGCDGSQSVATWRRSLVASGRWPGPPALRAAMLASAGQVQVARLTEKLRYRDNKLIKLMFPDGAHFLGQAPLRFRDFDGSMEDFCSQVRSTAESFARAQRCNSTAQEHNGIPSAHPS